MYIQIRTIVQLNTDKIFVICTALLCIKWNIP